MASLNTLTPLINPITDALDTVAREKVDSINAVSRDVSADQAAVGQVIRSHVAPAASLVDITPGAYAPDAGGQVIGNMDVTITKSKAVQIQWTGEEQLSVGGRATPILQDQIKQAFRALSNAVATDICAAARLGASRAYGTSGTAPFATAANLSDIAQMNQILDDNGAPSGDRHYVGGGGAWGNLRGLQSTLFKVNESGTDDMLRNGTLNLLQGFGMHQDRFVAASGAVGTGASYVLNGAHAVGSTSIVVKTGTGTILAGDVVTINGVKYLVTVGTAAAGTITIAAPGLQAAGADGNTVTINSAFTANFALHKNALVLASRAPKMPAGGDSAVDVAMVTDPISGVVYQIALYKQYRQVHFEIALAWGVKVVKPEFLALNLG